MSDIRERAAAAVAERIELGAVFTIAEDGQRWVWEAHPPMMRNAIRRYWDGVEDRNAPGFQAAMIRSIRRRGGADAP